MAKNNKKRIEYSEKQIEKIKAHERKKAQEGLVSKAFILFTASLMDVKKKTTENDIEAIYKTATRYLNHTQNELITIQKVTEIVEQRLGIKIDWDVE